MPDRSLCSTRRQFIKGVSLSTAATLMATPAVASSAASAVTSTAPARAKNLIFLVVDGLCAGTLGLAHHWQLRHKTLPLNWMQLYSVPGVYRAQQDTASASSPVTDSAAAASAWGGGQRVHNGSINMSEAGHMQEPILIRAKKAGKATGLVSTCRITHATPAGFAANVPQRNSEDVIARQYLEREIDVLLGGGARYFKTDDLVAQYEAKSYGIARDTKQLGALAGSPKLLGLFSESHMPYRIDRLYDSSYAATPGLPEMFQTAVQSLESNREGFVLQVEAGRVDHAGHVNDPATILHEFLEFDTCIGLALDYQQANPDTLLIVTTDHGTGGCQLNGLGAAYKDSAPALDRINDSTRSFEWLQDRFMKTGLFDAAVLEEMIGINVTPEKAAQIQAAIDLPVQYLSSTMTALLQEELMAQTAIGWTSNNHTAECVDFMARGPGAENLLPFIRNDAVFNFMTEALGLRQV
ncbi:MAG: alkaline phosphatase [Lentimonas sp.]|jgi:alkaline phosphatase